MEQTEDQMNLIMGIGPIIVLAPDVKKTLRVGTIKQIKDVAELYNSGLVSIKFSAHKKEVEYEEYTGRWIEILNIILIEGFNREEFENSIPELMESAVNRFLFS